MRLVVVSFVGLLLAACGNSPEQDSRMVSTAFCDCLHNTPALSEACIDHDFMPIVPAPSDECLQCVYENSQACLILFDKCFDLCVQLQPQP
ncbi:MAG TPA: hypothetical protein VFV99_14460 [Kofleriaceae bacterium]|nr:hypothetical protein [Kofleriaceae bacterium]